MLAKDSAPAHSPEEWGEKQEKTQQQFCSLRSTHHSLGALSLLSFQCSFVFLWEKKREGAVFLDAKIFHSGPSERELWNASMVLPGKHGISKGGTLSQNFTLLGGVRRGGRNKNRAREVLKWPQSGNYSFQYQSSLQSLI